MQPLKSPSSLPPDSSIRQEQSVQSTDTSGRADNGRAVNSWFGAIYNGFFRAIGYGETGTDTASALSDRTIAASVSGSSAHTGSIPAADPQPATPMELTEVLPALAEAISAKDAARVKSLLASLKLTSPNQAAQVAEDNLKTILQDYFPSARKIPQNDYIKLKKLIDCLLANCGNGGYALANSALNLFVVRGDFPHAQSVKDKHQAILEADHLQVALDKDVQNYAPYVKHTDDSYPRFLHSHSKALLALVDQQDHQTMEIARKTFADGLEKCLRDTQWVRGLPPQDFTEIERCFWEFYKFGIKDEELAYSFLNLFFIRGDYESAKKVASDGIRITDEDLCKALRDHFHQDSVKQLFELANPGAAGQKRTKETVLDILQQALVDVDRMPPHEIVNFESFIRSYICLLSKPVEGRLFLLNPLIDFCVRGEKIELAQRLKRIFKGCYLEPKAFENACEKLKQSATDELEKSETLKALSDLTEPAKIKTD
ncbi:hypothetical protein [Endozoicomonas sp. ALC020]|uniref:hypothetical protein n=1 Tax=unclassified Endozoicomonas TaxID=2644528 RepID=UPI003BB11568